MQVHGPSSDVARLLCAVALGTLAIASTAGTASAQVAEPQTAPANAPTPPVDEPAAADSETTAPGDILVTARRRNERLLDVPVAVTALDSAAIERYRSDNLASLTETVPTVQIAAFGANAGGTISVRGIGTPATQGGFEQAVSLVIDGVPLSNARLVRLGFFDMQQLEILKGPQALFFGKNSPAGVISLTSASPTDTFEGQARAAYEFVGDETIGDIILSGPLTDRLSARFALRGRNQEGWIYNTARAVPNPFNPANPLPGASDRRAGDREVLGRLSLRYEASDTFDVTLKAIGQRLRDDGPISQNIGPCPTGGPLVLAAGILATDPNGECEVDNRYAAGDTPPAIGSRLSGYRPGGNYSDNWASIVSVNANWKLADGLNLASTSGYIYWDQSTYYGFDQTTYSSLTTFDTESANIYSQELRLSSDFDGPLNFMLGGFYQSSSNFRYTDLKLNDSTNQALAPPAQCYNPALDLYSCYRKNALLEGNTLSAFGQVSYKPVPQLEISGGVRWTRERKDTHQVQFYGRGSFDVSTTVIPGSLDPTPGTIKAQFRDSNFSPEATVSYHPTPNSTVYVAYKTGYKSGGFGNSGPFTRTQTASAISFGPESVKGFEGGAKGRFGALRIEATAFAYDFTDLQVNTFDAATITFRIANAGKVVQRGFDLQGEYQLTPDLSLRANLAYTKNEFRDYVGQCYNIRYPTGTTRSQLGGAAAGVAPSAPAGCQFANATALTLIQDFEGRAPARSPEWAGSAGFSYQLPLNDGYKVNLNGDVIYSSGYFPGETMAPGTYQSDFGKINAGVQLISPFGWDLSLIGRNLTNRYVVAFAAERSNGLGAVLSPNENRGVVLRGREVTLQASYRF